jgi:ABC-type nitrate/sulfonate/bicarbonate transport system substrate-binding protein
MVMRLNASACVAAAALGLIATLAGPLPATAQDKTKVTVNSFNSATIWPLWAAKKIGAFEKEGLALESTYTRDSKSQMTGVIEGKFDIITTALDNVIAYSEGEGAPGTPKDGDLIALLGGNDGSLALIAQPEIKNVSELKGKELAVDAVATGFSFVLREILARNGLGPDDYMLTPFGATGARWEALQQKKAVAALLTPPFTLIAPARGFPNIADASGALGGYQGSVSAARRDWAKRNPDVVVRYIRAFRAGQDWLMNPDNKEDAIGLLRAEFPQTTPELGEATYRMLVASGKGYDAGAKIDMAGAKNVLDLRRRYGPKGKTVSDVGHFIDEGYFNQAIKP